jgi:hypothetical protein
MPKAKVTNKGKAPVKGPVKGAKAPVAESTAARKARLLAEEKAKARIRKQLCRPQPPSPSPGPDTGRIAQAQGRANCSGSSFSPAGPGILMRMSSPSSWGA